MAGVGAVTRQIRWRVAGELVLVAWLVAIAWLGRADAAAGAPRAVLMLLPGQPTGTQVASDAFASGARAALLEALPSGSSVFIEYTDLARLPTPEDQGKLRDWYRAKYAGHPLDLIIAAGQEPRGFMLRFRGELWTDKPLVFAAMDERSLAGLTLPLNSVAFTVRYDEEGTIGAALALLPDTEHAALVSGGSAIDRYLRAFWLEKLQRFAGRLDLIDLGGLPLHEIRSRLAALPPNTVVFMSSLYTDGSGRSLVTPEVLPKLAAAANRPMFTIHGSFMGYGIVGGMLTDYAAVGRQTGALAAAMLNGSASPRSPVALSGVNRLLFDWRELGRWHLDERRLPPGSAVLFRPPSPWELYRWPIAIGVSALVMQGVLIAGLLLQRSKRERVQRELEAQYSFETFLTDLSRFFADVPAPQIDREMRAGLRRIGEFFAVERVSLFELAPRKGRARVIHSWSAAGVEPLPAEVAAEAFPWTSRQLVGGREVTFSRRDALPLEASTDRATFAAFGVVSHASIPLVESGAARRVLAVTSVHEEKRWPAALVERLRLVGRMLVQILARKQAEIEFAESQALQRAMLSTLPSRIAVLDRDGRVLAVNRAWLGQSEGSDANLMGSARVGANFLEICREAKLVGEAGSREMTEAVEAVLLGAREFVEIEYGTKQPGKERWYRLSVIALRGQRGAVIARTDVTEQVQSREKLREFSGHLLAAQEEERRRVARELHDDLNQRLVLLALEVSQMETESGKGGASERVRRIGERVGEIAADVHRLAYRLHPFKLDYLGLVGAARSLCAEISAGHNVAITVEEREVPAKVAPEVAVCAYRVLQEALSNVVKHSGSTRAEVKLIGDGSRLLLTVRDFGIGASRELTETSHGLGLSSIRERLRLVDGALFFDPSVAPGTELSVQIPLARSGSAL